MAFGLQHLAGSALVLSCALSSEAMAQQMVDSYVAVIGQADRFNSSGAALSQPGDILAQDRANFHRFGVRQAGDTADQSFLTPQERARIPELLGAGSIDPEVAAAILGGQEVAMRIEVLGTGGQVTGMRVTLETDAEPQLALPQLGAPLPSDLTWAFGNYPANTVSIASADLYRGQDLLVSMRCIDANGGLSENVAGLSQTPGQVTLHLAPQFAGSGVAGQTVIADFVLGDGERLDLPLIWRAPPGAFSADLVLVPGLGARLAAGQVAIRAGAQTVSLAGSAGLREAMAQLSQACVSEAVVAAMGCEDVDAGPRLAQCILPGSAPAGGAGLASNPLQPLTTMPQTVAAPIPEGAALPSATAVRLMFLQALGGLQDLAPVVMGSNAPRLMTLPDFLTSEQAYAALRNPQTMLGPLQALVAKAVAQPVPRFVTLDLPLSHQLVNPDTPATSMSRPDIEKAFPRFGPHPAITELTLTTTRAVMGEADGMQIPLRLRQPFYLETPAPEPNWQYEVTRGAKLVLRVTLDLSNIRPDGDGLARMRSVAAADAEVRDATVILVTQERPGAEVFERALHRWEASDIAVPEVAAPQSAADISALYGMPMSGDRLVAQSIYEVSGLNAPETSVLGLPGYAGRDGSAVEALALALQLDALMTAGPDRVLDMDFTQGTVAPRLLTGPEAATLYPLALLSRSSNAPDLSELDRYAALTQGDAALREKIGQRSPTLPLPLRTVQRIDLPEYDFASHGFPLTPRVTFWLPLAARPYESQDLLPDLLAMDVDGARALQELLAANPDFAGGGSALYLAMDYSVTRLSAPTGLTGPIRDADLKQVTGLFHIDSLALFADAQLTRKIMDLPVPDMLRPGQTEGLQDLPAEVFASTYDTMLAAVAATDEGRVALEQGDFDPDNNHTWPAAQRADKLAAHRAQLLASARTDYWIGARLTLSPYDPAASGFPMSVNNLMVGNDIPPTIARTVGVSLRPAVAEDFTLLRVDPAQQEQVAALLDESGRVAVLMRAPLAEAGTGSGMYQLSFGAPTEVIFGPGGGANSAGFPQRIALRLALQTPNRTEAMNDGTAALVPPKTLVLDGEAIDLIALSLDPTLYDDTGFLRMLDERLAREQQADRDNAQAWPAHVLPWGRFFNPGTEALRPDQAQALLPAFRDWTLARSAVLPKRITLPIGADPHPVSRCTPLREIQNGSMAAPPPVMQLAESLIGGRTNYAAERLDLNALRPSVGPDRLWTNAASGRRVTWHSCGRSGLAERNSTGGRLVPAHVGMLLLVPDQPMLGRQALEEPVASASAVIVPRAGSATYDLDLTEARLAALPEGLTPPPGMQAVLILSGPVQAAATYEDSNPPNGTQLHGYTSKDWMASGAYPIAATDILGLTSGMTLAAFEAAVRQRMPDAQRWVTTQRADGLFGTALMLENPVTKEVIGATFLPDVPDQPVVAVMRFLELSEAQTPREALRQTFASKYGPVPLEDSAGNWVWGGLPSDLDASGLCGGRSTLHPGAAAQPRMAADGDPARQSSGTEWAGWNWPVTTDPGPGAQGPDPADCTPSLTVSTRSYEGRLMVQVWLMDRGLAERLAAVAPPAPPANIELDL
ncbi:hypothetical protein E4L95_11425 [Paracoccus liaowanqingii]|uniref:Uncharacterized protein n=1 Tax=Paracoccus liaowanqingii TaxID=2560053 RepID=A0A4Z1C8Z5_9RHOB|nr:hypothetical protein [Paracoccus liaowanqingii]TGN59708.1 hypothetical protein E4L95_11425 [Paracoccus liaowanqingii]